MRRACENGDKTDAAGLRSISLRTASLASSRHDGPYIVVVMSLVDKILALEEGAKMPHLPCSQPDQGEDRERGEALYAGVGGFCGRAGKEQGVSMTVHFASLHQLRSLARCPSPLVPLIFSSLLLR